MLRNPIVSGQFYESDFGLLDQQLTQCFESDFGPGALPTKRDFKKEIFGIISPHAGYPFSGSCAAWGFKEIAESTFYDTFILLGLSHSGLSSSVSFNDWKTPIGVVSNDLEFSKELNKLGLENNEQSHAIEHSIEVQLPFLQFASKDNLNDLKIVPIIVNSDFKEIAQKISQAIQKTNRKVCFIASSDFTHYGLNYGYMPFMKDKKENMYNLDYKAIDQIKQLSTFGFMDYINETKATICGRYPIACLIELANLFGKNDVKLLRYYTSGDIIQDYSNAVGYASILIR